MRPQGAASIQATPTYSGVSWFPIPESLLYGNPDWRRLTTTAKVMLLACMSEANAVIGENRGCFYRTNDEWRVRLCKHEHGHAAPISRKTVKAARDQISSFLQFEQGRRIGNLNLSTEYLVPDSLINPGDIKGHFAQMPRYMFDDILWRMGCYAVLAYTYLSAEYWRNRGKHDDHRFYIQLGELQRESGLRDFYQQIEKLHRSFKFKNGNHLFEFQGYRRIAFRDWITASADANSTIELEREKDIELRAKKLTEERELSRVLA